MGTTEAVSIRLPARAEQDKVATLSSFSLRLLHSSSVRYCVKGRLHSKVLFHFSEMLLFFNDRNQSMFSFP